MKVILNHDVPNLGEVGDIKEVARGYARNYLLPRMLAFVFNQKTEALFEKRKAEIAARKEEKRLASSSLKERIEADEYSLDMPAGVNGKLFGAVTSASIIDELLKKGIEIDRKKVEVPDKSIKSVGNYKITIRLYEGETATLRLTVKGHVEKSKADHEANARSAAKPHHRHEKKEESVAAPAAGEVQEAPVS
jgi:large subunit ribosomal protein L9